MNRQRIVIESPLKGDTKTNRRYATWCCRYMHERGYSPLASHLVAPWFMDDDVLADREAGIDMPWFWQPDVPHYFFVDLGESTGMGAARERCTSLGISVVDGYRLPARYWRKHQDGRWPPHTRGFGPEQEGIEDFDVQAGDRGGAHAQLPHGWCNPDHPNFDPAVVEKATREQDAYDRSVSPDEEDRSTADLVESLREILKLPPKSGPPESQ